MYFEISSFNHIQDDHYIIDVLLKVTKNPYKQKNPEEPEHLFSEKGHMEALALTLDSVCQVSSLRILVPTDLIKESNKK